MGGSLQKCDDGQHAAHGGATVAAATFAAASEFAPPAGVATGGVPSHARITETQQLCDANQRSCEW